MLCKDKGNNKDCTNYTGIILLILPGKLFGTVLIAGGTRKPGAKWEMKKLDLRGKGCSIDPVLGKCVKIPKKWNSFVCAITDLKKAYNKINRMAMWPVLQACEVGGKQLRVVQSFYKESWACVRMGREEREYFPSDDLSNSVMSCPSGCSTSSWVE